jgi:hypothetical protein
MLRSMLGRSTRVGAIVVALWLVLAPIASAFNSPDLPVMAPAAASNYQTYYNPFGDPWEAKAAPNPSFPVALTPACRNHGLKAGQTTPVADEVTFIAQSNSIILDECAEPPDPDDGVGDTPLKTFISAVKAKNPDSRYVAYFQPAIAVPAWMADLTGPYPVGLPSIVKNHEDWFVHQKGAAPTPQNRVPSTVSAPLGYLFDVTNPAFRTYMADQIVKSMDFHGIWGISIDACFDQPEVAAGYAVPDSVAANWENGCIDLLAQLKARLNPQGRKVYFWGLIHIGTQGAPSAVNEPAKFALFQRRSQVSNGMAWEDPFQGVALSPDNVESNLSRLNSVIDYTRSIGNDLIIAINTNAGAQSTYASTNSGQQHEFARYYAAGFLNFLTGPDTIMAYYNPTRDSDQFYSAAFYREWNIRLGNALGGSESPQGGVLMRRFEHGVAVFNYGYDSFNASLGTGYINADGSPTSDFTVPAKSGRIWGKSDSLAPPAPTATPLPPPTCTPRPAVTLVTTPGSNQLQVTVSATGTNNALVSLHFENTANASIDVGGQTGMAGTFDVPISSLPTSMSFVVRRQAAGPVTVPLVVTDRCGTWRTFVGGGARAF